MDAILTNNSSITNTIWTLDWGSPTGQDAFTISLCPLGGGPVGTSEGKTLAEALLLTKFHWFNVIGIPPRGTITQALLDSFPDKLAEDCCGWLSAWTSTGRPFGWSILWVPYCVLNPHASKVHDVHKYPDHWTKNYCQLASLVDIFLPLGQDQSISRRLILWDLSFAPLFLLGPIKTAYALLLIAVNHNFQLPVILDCHHQDQCFLL